MVLVLAVLVSHRIIEADLAGRCVFVCYHDIFLGFYGLCHSRRRRQSRFDYAMSPGVI